MNPTPYDICVYTLIALSVGLLLALLRCLRLLDRERLRADRAERELSRRRVRPTPPVRVPTLSTPVPELTATQPLPVWDPWRGFQGNIGDAT
jgi:hypothetical protein